MAEIIAMPKLGFDMAEGTLVRWLKHEGETVAKGEVLAEIETDKATVEVEASVSGTVRRLLVGERSTVPVGAPIAVLGSPDESIDDLSPSVLAGALGRAGTRSPRGCPCSDPRRRNPPRRPKACREACGLRPLHAASPKSRASILTRLHGSGPEGRIVKKDVIAAAPAPAGVPAGTGESIPLTRLRAAIGRRMQSSKQQVPHFYLTVDLDVRTLVDLRSQLNAVQPEDARFSVNDFVVKAAALALRDVPGLNASLLGNSLVRHAEVNIGVAVAVEEGLLTVVVRQADLKSLRQIGEEVRAMAARARLGRVRPEDVEGSTFTVSNLGMFDIDHFVAIINPPEAAILAVGSVRETPVVQGGQLMAGLRLKVTLSADHRVTDGAEAARWLQAFRSRLEHPAGMLL